MKLSNLKEYLFYSLFAVKILIVTNWFIEGDQEAYSAAYESITNNIALSILSYQSQINTTINIHFLFAFVFKFLGFSKYWFGVISSISIFLVWFKLFRKRFGIATDYAFIILNTYYFDVLYFSAERLKFSILFIGLFLLNRRSYNLILSFGSHLQSLIFLPLFQNYFKKRNLLLLTSVVIIAGLYFDLLIYVKSKFIGYFQDFGGEFPLKTIILLTPLHLNKYYRFDTKIYISFYFLSLAILLGDLRINIILFLFLLILKHTRRTYQIMRILNLYFLIKTIPFLYKGYLYGTGF